MSGVDGKVVAITGASSGIGEATSVELAARGAAVVLGARRTDRLDTVAEQIRGSGGTAELLRVDVTNRADLERLVAAAVERFGRLDVLVSNAGIARTAPVTALDIEDWEAMIDVNLRGVLYGVAAALPVFRSQGRGHFVTIVSTSGLKIVPTQAAYAATKNAVRTFLEAFRQESTDGVVRTTSISPGFVRTELVDAIGDPAARQEAQQRMATLGIGPDAVARAVAFAIEQPDDVEIGDLTIRPTRQKLTSAHSVEASSRLTVAAQGQPATPRPFEVATPTVLPPVVAVPPVATSAECGVASVPTARRCWLVQRGDGCAQLVEGGDGVSCESLIITAFGIGPCQEAPLEGEDAQFGGDRRSGFRNSSADERGGHRGGESD